MVTLRLQAIAKIIACKKGRREKGLFYEWTKKKKKEIRSKSSKFRIHSVKKTFLSFLLKKKEKSLGIKNNNKKKPFDSIIIK